MHSHQTQTRIRTFAKKYISIQITTRPAYTRICIRWEPKNGETRKNKRQRCGCTIYCFYRKTDDKCNKSALVLLNSIFGKLSQRKISERMHNDDEDGKAKKMTKRDVRL